MSAGRSDQPGGRTGAVAALSVVVAVVLGDSGVVTLALPEILRDFGTGVGEVAWVLIAFNLVLAVVAVPAARVCMRGNPALATMVGLVGFAIATTACAVAPSLGVLVAARAIEPGRVSRRLDIGDDLSSGQESLLGCHDDRSIQKSCISGVFASCWSPAGRFRISLGTSACRWRRCASVCGRWRLMRG